MLNVTGWELQTINHFLYYATVVAVCQVLKGNARLWPSNQGDRHPAQDGEGVIHITWSKLTLAEANATIYQGAEDWPSRARRYCIFPVYSVLP